MIGNEEAAMDTGGGTSPSEHQSATMCPGCGLPRVHRSRRKGFTERVFAFAGAKWSRCHSCDLRFARLMKSTIYADDARRALRRVAVLLLLMIAGALFVLGVMIWIMQRQAAFPST
ncbi:MAG: hypothetical protein ABSG25_02130 [Bryobacteraceae bacterium]